jgi:hypothetical protein
MLESRLKSDQRKEFEALGWKFVQFGNDAPTGFPDTLCIAPHGYSCFVEWKKDRFSKKQPLQQYWHDKLTEMGHNVWFVNSQNVNEWRAKVLWKS